MSCHVTLWVHVMDNVEGQEDVGAGMWVDEDMGDKDVGQGCV